MAIIQATNLGLRFVLELCLLGALGYWGFQLEQGWLVRVLMGIGVPLLAAVTWGMFIAPKAEHLLADPWRFGLEFFLFGVGAAALWVAEQPAPAAALFFIYLINRIVLMAWPQR